MINYNNTLIEYFKANDTDFKKLINCEFEKSILSSFVQFMEEFFSRIGLMSCIITPIVPQEWNVKYTLSTNNIFSEASGTFIVNEEPINRKEAEELLAKEIIEILSVVDMNKVNERIK